MLILAIQCTMFLPYNVSLKPNNWKPFKFAPYTSLKRQAVYMHKYLPLSQFIKFYRLVRFNKRFRAIFNTLALVLPRIISIIVLLMLIYYFFAIIGMEAFNGAVEQNCCKLVLYNNYCAIIHACIRHVYVCTYVCTHVCA